MFRTKKLLFNPVKYINRYCEAKRAISWRNRLDEIYRIHKPPITPNTDHVVICEGMWDNPNHWFRLYLAIKALARFHNFRLIGVLRRHRDYLQRKTLESLGVNEFVYLEENHISLDAMQSQAAKMLSGVKDYWDLLKLKLPVDLPAHIYYDTALKLERSPQPHLSSRVWQRALGGALRDLVFYEELFNKNNVLGVVSSHPWKNEYATLCWTAISRHIPFYFLTAYNESIRIRRMIKPQDYYIPLEYMDIKEYNSLSENTKRKIALRGDEYLSERFSRNSTDINVQYAFHPEARAHDQRRAKEMLGINSHKPLVLIFGSVWFDFPHYFGMSNFTDFLDWIRTTVEIVKENKSVIWALRPHPVEAWYGGYRMKDLVKDLPDNIIMINKQVDSLTAQNAADAIVTVHGTVAVEAVARGIRTLSADRSYYSDWQFAIGSDSKKDYCHKLVNIIDLPNPDPLQIEKAKVFVATTIGNPPTSLRHLRLEDDTKQNALYPGLYARFTNEQDEIENEVECISAWVKKQHHSFNAFRIVEHYSPSEVEKGRDLT
jgi:hypothetical protein